MAPPERPANFWAPFRPEIRILQAVPAHRVQPSPDFCCFSHGVHRPEGFPQFPVWPNSCWGAEILVVHRERPTSDFLGTSAGPMGVCRAARSSFVAVGLHHMGRAAVAARETGAVEALVMRLFGAVRTKRS